MTNASRLKEFAQEIAKLKKRVRELEQRYANVADKTARMGRAG